MKYRKKPIEVEAIQLTEENAKEIAEWCNGACENFMINPPKFGCLHVNFLEDKRILREEMIAFAGDWIIKESDGEFYPCKPKKFEKTYEKVEVEK